MKQYKRESSSRIEKCKATGETKTGDGIVEHDIDGKYIFNYLYSPENNIILPDYYSCSEDFIKELIEFCNE